MKTLTILLTALALAVVPAFAHEHGDHADADHDQTNALENITVTGEVLDMACYLDHGAQGAKHADCAKTCIESGLPVGIKANDGKTYLLIGEHKPINEGLAHHAGQTITVSGKAVSRDGFNMIENADLVSTNETAAVSYTCPMHPEVVSGKPGDCPKCGMKLVRKKE